VQIQKLTYDLSWPGFPDGIRIECRSRGVFWLVGTGKPWRRGQLGLRLNEHRLQRSTSSYFQGWLSLYFSSDRPGGCGGLDIWVSQRESSDAPWEQPFNLGCAVNSSANDLAPNLTTDGHLLFFHSFRPTDNCGGGDIFTPTGKIAVMTWIGSRPETSTALAATRTTLCFVVRSTVRFSLIRRIPMPALLTFRMIQQT